MTASLSLRDISVEFPIYTGGALLPPNYLRRAIVDSDINLALRKRGNPFAEVKSDR